MMRPAYIALGTGLDLVTPPVQRSPGAAIGGQNYEPRPEGYRRVAGFERYDGTGLPSAATYHVLSFDGGSGAIATGQTVTGAISGATGIAAIDAVVESGSWAGGDAAGYLVLRSVSGTFQDNENLTVSAVVKAVTNGVAVLSGADNDTDDRAWKALAVEAKRASITAVPGSGAIRGVWKHDGVLYAFRDNAGGSACVMHKATGSGWSAVSLGWEIKFDGGSGAISDGQTVTGATSGATGLVSRVVLQDGDWTTSDAAGRLILSATTGTFQDNENFQVGGVTKALANGVRSAITLAPGGRYQFQSYNFFGASDRYRLYGCDGVNRAFEFDGTVFVPIVTGMTADAPTHLACHANHLFLAFPGGSLQNSALGNPYSWEVVLGAGEIGLGEDITNLLTGYAKVLIITGTNRTAILYGTVFAGTEADAQLDVVSAQAGAVEWSMQHMREPTCLDAVGIRTLSQTQAFGDFKAGTVSTRVDPLLDIIRSSGASLTETIRIKTADQMRLFWSDGRGLIMDWSGKYPAFMPLTYGKVVRVAAAIETSDGSEELWFGSDDGYVYRMDSGTSFDGQAIDYLVRLAFNHLGSPGINKVFGKVTLECKAVAGASIRITADFGYGNPDLPSENGQTFSVVGGGGFWNESTWNEFYWSQVEGEAEAYIDGFGTNISVALAGQSSTETVHTIHGLHINFSPRGLRR